MRWLCVVLMACGGTTESFVDEAGETQEVTPPVETVADADTQSKPSSPPQGAVDLHPAVFALTLKGDACQWTLVSVSSGKSATVNTTPTCPSEIVFNQKQNAVVYRTEKGLYQSDWPVAGPPSPIGGLSSVGGSLETIHGLGFHKGALRIGLLVEAPSTVEGDVRTYRFAGKTLQSRITDDGDYFKRVGGQTVPANEGDAEAVWMDPNWGIAGVGAIAERSSAGAWSVVEAAPTQWGAGDTMGLDMLSASVHSDAKLSVLEWAGAGPKQPESATTAEANRSALSKELGSSEWGSTVMDGGELLTMEAMGDTMHSVTPAYLCNPGCKSRTELSDVAKHMTQLDISVEGDYVLISKEYTHAKGLVYQAGKQAKPVLNLSEASLVVWAPKNALWTSVAFE